MLRIKKLDIFIAKQFGLLFMGTFFICQFVLMMQFLWRYIDELIGKGLTMDVMAQFFWYMGLMLVPQALPLAILLSSLMTFGNLGESSELTAIKAAGISLMQAFRSLIVITIIIMFGSFYFQNNVGPKSNMKLAQLLISMKQKSPELEIPEGIFYDGIPNCNLYVQKKDLKTGKLYGIMIYRMTDSYEDAAIILADSGMLQSTAEKKHLVLSLYSGEWFENMQSSALANTAAVPYRRETFVSKKIILDFDGDFSMTDAASLSGNAKGKSLEKINHDIDSLNQLYDSIGRIYLNEANVRFYGGVQRINKNDSLKEIKKGEKLNFDTLYNKLPQDKKLMAANQAQSTVQQELSDLDFKSMSTSDADYMIRQHKIEAINKFTLALSCLIFFFIGAPLGAIIRKGGLGDIAEKYGVEIDFRPFIKVEPLSSKEFRTQQKISILDHTAVVFTARTAIDHFFHLCEELRVAIPETMKYFCMTEAIAVYLQKYIVYRKRKIFFGQTGKLDDLVTVIGKRPKEKYLVPVSDVHKDDLLTMLEAKKISFTKAVMYRTVSNDFSKDEKFDYDMLVFFSPSGISSLLKNLPNLKQEDIKIGCFGPTTAKAVKEAGLRLDVEDADSRSSVYDGCPGIVSEKRDG